MRNTNTGGPAFPTPRYERGDMYSLGMTLRDYFAAKAMQGLIAHEKAAMPAESRNTGDFDQRVSYAAYRYADAMLKARDQ